MAPKHPVQAIDGGWVQSIDGRKLGQLCVDLGGGRKKTEDSIDHGVGIEILIRPGERVEPGQTWAYVFSRRELRPKELDDIQTSLCLAKLKPAIPPIILDRISA